LRLISMAIGTLMAAAALVVAPIQASAIPPSAPYTALIIDSNDLGPQVFDPGNSTITFDYSTPNRYTMTATPSSGGAVAQVTVELPPGDAYPSGTYFPIATTADTSHASIVITYPGLSCTNYSGSVNPIVASHAATPLTSFKMESYIACGSDPNASLGARMYWQVSDPYVASLESAPALDFGDVEVGETSAPKTITITDVGPGQLNFSFFYFGDATGFTATANTCENAHLSYGETCAMTFVVRPFAVQPVNNIFSYSRNSGGLSQLWINLHANGVRSPAGRFFPFGPTRILDTRDGTGGRPTALGQVDTYSLKVAGAFHIPSIGVGSVVLNVTAANPTAMSYLTIYPAGATRPVASNLNFTPGVTVANSVTVLVGTGGKINIFNQGGTVDVIVDIVGYYAGSDALGELGGKFVPSNPTRIVDTRASPYSGPLPGGYYLGVVADYGPTINPHVRALAINLTAVDPQGSGYLTTWNGSGQPTLSSTVNYRPGQNIPNFAVVPTSDCSNLGSDCSGIPAIGVFNGSATPVHVLVDVVGYFSDSTYEYGHGLVFTPVTPYRIADTRSGLGAPSGLTAGGHARILDPVSVNDLSVIALAMNVTAVAPTATAYLTVWPAGAQPNTSTLNVTPGIDKPNAVYTVIDTGGGFNIFNSAGHVDIVNDVAGYFRAGAPDSTSPTIASNGATPTASRPVVEAGPQVSPGVPYLVSR
jgi:hypothetical protein